MDRTVLSGNYKIGGTSWDTGICKECNTFLTNDERRQAAINMLIAGMMYWCEPCIKAFFEKNKGIFR